MALHRIISVSSANQTLKTLLVLDSTQQHTAISRFHVRRATLVIVHLQSTGQRHGTDYQQQSGHLTLQNFKKQLKAPFFWWTISFLPFILSARPRIWLRVTAPKKLMLYYYYYYYCKSIETGPCQISSVNVDSRHRWLVPVTNFESSSLSFSDVANDAFILLETTATVSK